ncbi:MAG: aldo/keto reductase [Phenylobacterium sp.]|uniref:aldo/keto reductase n=1 Tax=Phenylobacterium sp. TaxID=1871053 RepID=UPI001B51BAF1|nr:aldo/keto reductase [Phenylobacterium sp.]MBP7648812.1 aldo/keto reductase [Phenylobacterium sp.]MBP7815166.1 aldo/keto reductase [Phenylobacterium sp.]
MLYRPLGATGLTVSEIGFGCASWWGQGAFDEGAAIALVHAALDRGVTFFDTGASYSSGNAEPRLGRALRGRDLSALVIATKAGTAHNGRRIVRDMSPAAIEASVLRSLGNLGLERLPLLQLHGPAIIDLTDELLASLESLKVRGLIDALGVNSFDPAVIDHVAGLPQFDVVMVDYNVLRPERGPLIARAAAVGKGVLAGMPLAMGHTGGQVLKLRTPRDIWYALRALKNHRAEVLAGRRFGFLHQEPGITGAQAALAYVLANPNVACAVTGTTRMGHLLENLSASGMALPLALAARISQAQAT